MDIADLVGPEAIDPLRGSDYYVQPFQNRGQFADAPARIAAFECFVLRCLDLLQTHQGLARFGLSVRSELGFDRDCPSLPKVIITQKVSLISEGTVRPLVNVQEFYSACFPFSGVYDGEFVLDRADERVQRYLEATASKDHDVRRCMLALLSAQADSSFSAPVLEIRPAC
jgi:hypothetical protein